MAAVASPFCERWISPADEREFASQLLPAIASVIADVCAVNDKRPPPQSSKFASLTVAPISVVDYLQRINMFSECSTTCFVLALVYMDRIQGHPDVLLNSLTVHRLLITSVMVAAKSHDDAFYNNSFFARIGGISAQELNALELEFLFLLGFHVTATMDEFCRYETELRRHVSVMATRASAARALSSPSPALCTPTSMEYDSLEDASSEVSDVCVSVKRQSSRDSTGDGPPSARSSSSCSSSRGGLVEPARRAAQKRRPSTDQFVAEQRHVQQQQHQYQRQQPQVGLQQARWQSRRSALPVAPKLSCSPQAEAFFTAEDSPAAMLNWLAIK